MNHSPTHSNFQTTPQGYPNQYLRNWPILAQSVSELLDDAQKSHFPQSLVPRPPPLSLGASKEKVHRVAFR